MNRVVILAGGRGERLLPLTEDRPKPMVDVMGSPLLAYQIRWLTAYGYKKITICCGYQHEVIMDYFGDGSKIHAEISYSIEDEPLGRGGALKKALLGLPVPHDPIIALNGDVLTDLNLYDLLSYHRKRRGLATVVAVPLTSPYGIVDIRADGTVKAFREKPELPYWINAGIYVFEPEISQMLPDKGDHEVTTFPQIAASGQLKAFQTCGFWRPVDSIKDLRELRKDLEQGFFGRVAGSIANYP